MSNIIEIEGFKFKKLTRYDRDLKKGCQHKEFELDQKGHIVICTQCGIQLSAYWVLEEMVSYWDRIQSNLQRRLDKVVELENKNLFLKVLEKVQKAWRKKKKMAVCCPWCHVGIMPEDGFGTITVDPEFDFRRRRLIQEKKVEQETE